MKKIEEVLSLNLNRVNLLFKNEEIITECLKNHGGFSLLGEHHGPFEKGNKYKLKYF